MYKLHNSKLQCKLLLYISQAQKTLHHAEGFLIGAAGFMLLLTLLRGI